MLLIRRMWLAMKSVLSVARQDINLKLKPLGLSGAEGDVLFLLLTGSNQLQQEQLAEQLGIDKAAVSRVIDSLVSKGYVMRMQHREDKRAYNICLTDTASAMSDAVINIYEGLYARAGKGISEDELTRIESILSQVLVNLQTGDNI
jgi:DNA-binding MarR family transcriptional regulator